MAYLAGNPLHGYRIGCPQRRRLEYVSVSGVPVGIVRDPTISLNRNRWERGCSLEIVRHEVCRRGGSSESEGNSIKSLHFDGGRVLQWIEWCTEVLGTCSDVLLMKRNKESGPNGIKSRESDCGVWLLKSLTA